MAGEWNNMKDKMGQSTGGPSPADWEAMRAKIEAQPALSPAAGAKPWFAWILAGGIGLSIGLGAWFIGASNSSTSDEAGQEFLAEPQFQESPAQELVQTPVVDSDAITQEDYNSKQTARELESEKSVISNSAVNDIQSQNEIANNKAVAAASFSEPEVSETLGAQGSTRLIESARTEAPESAQVEESPQLREEAQVLVNESAKATSATEGAASELADNPQTNEQVKAPSVLNTSKDELGDTEGQSTQKSAEVEDTPPSPPAEDKGSAGEPEEAAATSLDEPLLPKTEQELADNQVSPPFISPKTGFRLSAANLGFGMQSDLSANSPLIYGLGFDLQWQRDRQFFSAGLAYYQVQEPYQLNFLESRQRIDSTYKEQIEDRTVIEVSRVWVIDSFQAGRYVYDTTITIVSDTNIVLQVDTNHIETSIVKQLERKYSYAELPLLYGYEFGANKMRFRMAGGLALQQAVAYSDAEGGTQTRFGLSALMQPELLWQLNPAWSLSGRVQLRYPLQSDFVLYQNRALRYSFQLGVSYRW